MTMGSSPMLGPVESEESARDLPDTTSQDRCRAAGVYR
jgi:hypothetical protein